MRIMGGTESDGKQFSCWQPFIFF